MISMLVRESSAPVGSSARMMLRIVDQAAGNRHALLLAAGELVGMMIRAPRQAYDRVARSSPARGLDRRLPVAVKQRQFDVLKRAWCAPAD